VTTPAVTMSTGFTPVRLFGKTLQHTPGEQVTRVIGAGSSASFYSLKTSEPNATTALISYILATRIANPERLVAAELTGWDAPFVWEVVQIRLVCGSSPGAGVSVAVSEFPTTDLYISGALAGTNDQSNLVGFIEDGGRAISGLVHPAGVGPLALTPTCSTSLSWSNTSGVLGTAAATCADDVGYGNDGGPGGGSL